MLSQRTESSNLRIKHCEGFRDIFRPANAISRLMSPWTDLTLDIKNEPSLIANQRDDFVQRSSLVHYANLLLNGDAQYAYIQFCCRLLTSRSHRKSGLVDFILDKTLRLFPRAHPKKRSEDDSLHAHFTLPPDEDLPRGGVLVCYGSKEVLRSQIQNLVQNRRVQTLRRDNGLHAFVIASVFLGRDERERGQAINAIVSFVRSAI